MACSIGGGRGIEPHSGKCQFNWSPAPCQTSAGVALYSDQQAIDSTSPFGKAMI
jgi:hypothetical protein